MSDILDKAVFRLANVNSPFKDKYDTESDYIKTLEVLCEYLHTGLKIPPRDIAFSNLTEEILHMSGLCGKEVALDGNWWKHENGVMLGTLNDGTHIALLPNRLFGYSIYYPKQDRIVKITDEAASEVNVKAIAVFRRFPQKNIKFGDVLKFIIGENIYKELAIILIGSFVASIMQVIPPVISAQIFNTIVPEDRKGLLLQVILILIAFGIADIGFSIITNLGISRINTKISVALQTAVWDKLLHLRIPFFSEFTTGELLHKIKGIERIKNLVSVNNIKVIISNLFIFVNVIVLFNYYPAITLAVLPMLSSVILVYAVVNIKKYKLYKKYIRIENNATTFNQQSIQGIHRIKISCAEERIYNKWSMLEAEKRTIMNTIELLDNIFDSFCIFFSFASTAVVYFLIVKMNETAIGSFVAYIATFLILQSSVVRLLKSLEMLPELISVSENLKPILEAIPEYTLKTIPKDMTGTLEVNNAVFRYEKYGRTIINDVSFRVEDGECVGIIGGSGSGKTTLIKLLMGFYELTSGRIYYGGYDLETIDLHYLRKQMGIVLQDGGLTADDIYSNVTDNDENISYNELMDALHKVGLAEMVESLPDGIHTRLENQPLSNGEKQRLLVARAIVKKNKFIFLDEATSNLDNVSQSAIMKALRDIPATKIVIAQRLATVEYCDKIIVIDNGGIIEQSIY